MKKRSKQIFIVFFLLTTLLGCSNRSDTVSNTMEEKFQTVIPVIDMNESLQITIDDDKTIFRLGSEIPLLVQNKSADYVFFTPDNYIKLFMIQDGEWIEVKNELTYIGDRVLSPKGTVLLDIKRAWAQPTFDKNMFEDNKTEILIRIVTIGEIMEKDTRTGELVGAYVDVYISP